MSWSCRSERCVTGCHETEEANREALHNVEEAGRLALAELRRLLDAMRRDDRDLALAPQPGLSEIDGLVDEVRAAGLDVALDIQGEPVRLAPGLDLSAYRIVQEGLTNTLRHAAAQHTKVMFATPRPVSSSRCATTAGVPESQTAEAMGWSGSGNGSGSTAAR